MKILAVIPDPDLPETHLLRGVAARAELRMVVSAASKRLVDVQDVAPWVSAPFRSRIDRHSVSTVRHQILDWKPDIIHCFSSRALSVTLAATRTLSTPIVVYRGTMGRVSRFDPSSWMSYLHPRVSGFICVSEAVRQYLLRFIPKPSMVRTIYKGHDPRWYTAAPVAALQELGMPVGVPVISCVANMRPVKGVDLLIKAFIDSASTHNAHLLLIGEIRDRKVAEALHAHPLADRIHCCGYRADAAALVARTDIFVMCSREREGFPKAVVEAMVQGVPAVVTAVGGMPELVLDEETGIVVPPGDAAALSKALIRLLSNPDQRMQMGKNARRRIEQHFRIEQTIEQTFNFYTEVIAEKERGKVKRPNSQSDVS